jgi:hypothetical protein
MQTQWDQYYSIEVTPKTRRQTVTGPPFPRARFHGSAEDPCGDLHPHRAPGRA